MSGRSTWRCFPWKARAGIGEPFSAAYLVPGQTVGRFDLHDRPPVRYLAESPEHAIAETLSAFRGTEFLPAYLSHSGHPLALVEVTLSAQLMDNVVDLSDPAELSARNIRPDMLADHDRTLTQSISRQIHREPQRTGLRWWSSLTGAWHAVVVFTDRQRSLDVTFGAPAILTMGAPELTRALTSLGIRVR